MKSPSRNALAFLCAVLTWAFPPAPSFAQIEEVVVTAQRREQSLQDVPLALTVLDEEALNARQIDEPLDIIHYVPNLFGTNNTGLGTANAYYLRGLGNTESIATFDPPVGTYVDNVYVARQNGNNVAFFDVERVEVVRGPQGTLFGRNTTGGAVLMHMRKPSEERRFFMEAGGGDFGRWFGRASADLPLGDQALSKLSAFYINEDGYVKNRATGQKLNGQETWGVRGDLRLLPSEAVVWDLSVEAIQDDNLNMLNTFGGLSAFQRPQDNGITDNTDNRYSQVSIRASRSAGTLEQLSRSEGLGNNVESWALSSNLNWGTALGSLEFITAYRSLSQKFIIDFFDGAGPVGGFTIANDGDHTQFSQEVKLTNSLMDDRLDLVAGLFYFDEKNDTDFSDVFALSFGNLLLADRMLQNDVFSFALYAQGDMRFTEQLTVTLGGRWTKEEKELDYQDFKPALAANNPYSNILIFGAAPGTELNTANLEALGIDTELNESIFTPRVAVQYRLNDDLMAFASYTEGFKSGGWNARGTSAEELLPFDPERVSSWEVGLRSEWWDRRLRLNLTAFFMEAEDFQVPSAFTRANGSIAFITQNFADLENNGVELDLTLAPTEQLSLYASLGIQDAEQKPGAAIQAQIQRCLAGDAGAAGRGIVDGDCEVAPPTRSPDFTLAIGGSYRFDIPALNGHLAASVNYRRNSDMNVTTNGLPNGHMGDTGQLNAGLTLGVGENLRFTLECDNCNNELIQHSVLAGTFYYNEPRRVNFRARWDL